MNIEFNEQTYSRYKALGLTDAEVTHLLGVSTNKLQRFKMDMDYFDYDSFYEDNLDHKITLNYKKRINK